MAGRAVTAALLIALWPLPAHACHLYSVWHYPFRQRCPAPPAPHPRPHRPPSPASIPLPALAGIDWGQPPDDETLGRLMLRAKMEGQ